MSNEYYKVLSNLWKKENDKRSYAPLSFKEVLGREKPLFQGNDNDSNSRDLIDFLLERFHQELNQINVNIKPTNYQFSDKLDEKKMLNLFIKKFKMEFCSIISELFYGIMETKYQCDRCKKIEYNFQIYTFLEFHLESVNKYCFNRGLRKNNDNENKNLDINLFECFDYLGNTELMTGENQMYCNICKRCCDAFYSISLYSTPHYLIINLKRNSDLSEYNVVFPEKLNLLNFVSYKEGNTYFELYAVISHIGPSSMNGYFIAYCKSNIDKKWYKYNDAIVTPCDKKDEYKNGIPYILFYQAL